MPGRRTRKRNTCNQRFAISAGILTHYAPKTLDDTLKTYKKSGLFDLIDDVFVVIQKSDRQMEEKDVCEKYELRYVLMSENGKMGGGFRGIYDHAKHNVLLPLENDWHIYFKAADVKSFLQNAMYFLLETDCDIVRGRSRERPGLPNMAHEWYIKDPVNYRKNHARFLCESFFWELEPENKYSDVISRITPLIGTPADEPAATSYFPSRAAAFSKNMKVQEASGIRSDAWYASSSQYCNYTNNPYLCTRQFFRKAILPSAVPGSYIEGSIDKSWAKADYTCVFGPGLFTHNRPYDGHNFKDNSYTVDMKK